MWLQNHLITTFYPVYSDVCLLKQITKQATLQNVQPAVQVGWKPQSKRCLRSTLPLRRYKDVGMMWQQARNSFLPIELHLLKVYRDSLLCLNHFIRTVWAWYSSELLQLLWHSNHLYCPKILTNTEKVFANILAGRCNRMWASNPHFSICAENTWVEMKKIWNKLYFL